MRREYGGSMAVSICVEPFQGRYVEIIASWYRRGQPSALTLVRTSQLERIGVASTIDEEFKRQFVCAHLGCT